MASGGLKPTRSLTKAQSNIREFLVLMAVTGPHFAIYLIFRITSVFAIYGAITTAWVHLSQFIRDSGMEPVFLDLTTFA